MRFEILDEDEVFDNFEDVLEYCIKSDYHEDDSEFEDAINEEYGSFDIGDNTYWAYDILDEFGDTYSFRRDYCERCNNSDIDEAWYNLERAKPGDKIYIQDYTVLCLEDDKEIKEVSLDELRSKLEEEHSVRISQTVEQEKDENNLMKCLQIIGG